MASEHVSLRARARCGRPDRAVTLIKDTAMAEQVDLSAGRSLAPHLQLQFYAWAVDMQKRLDAEHALEQASTVPREREEYRMPESASVHDSVHDEVEYEDKVAGVMSDEAHISQPSVSGRVGKGRGSGPITRRHDHLMQEHGEVEHEDKDKDDCVLEAAGVMSDESLIPQSSVLGKVGEKMDSAPRTCLHDHSMYGHDDVEHEDKNKVDCLFEVAGDMSDEAHIPQPAVFGKVGKGRGSVPLTCQHHPVLGHDAVEHDDKAAHVDGTCFVDNKVAHVPRQGCQYFYFEPDAEDDDDVHDFVALAYRSFAASAATDDMQDRGRHMCRVAGGDVASDGAFSAVLTNRRSENRRITNSRMSRRRRTHQQPQQHTSVQRGSADDGDSHDDRKASSCSLAPCAGTSAASSEIVDIS